MAQTIEAFVGKSLDEAKISPLHKKIVGLIAAGYFFDVIDFTIFGSLVPYILQSKFATGAEVAAIGSATIFGMFIGVGALAVWVLRFALPESPRYLATHGRGQEALAVLAKLDIPGPKEPLTEDAASNTKSDPFGVVFRLFPKRVIAGMICFTAFFGVAIGLGAWLPNMMNAKGFSVTKSLQYTLAMNFAVP